MSCADSRSTTLPSSLSTPGALFPIAAAQFRWCRRTPTTTSTKRNLQIFHNLTVLRESFRRSYTRRKYPRDDTNDSPVELGLGHCTWSYYKWLRGAQSGFRSARFGGSSGPQSDQSVGCGFQRYQPVLGGQQPLGHLHFV